MRARFVAAGCAVVIAAVTTEARADDARGGFGFVLYMIGQLVPAQVGLDRAVATDPDPRLRFGWVDQIPLGVFTDQTDDAWIREADPLWQHRVVVSLSLSYGLQEQGEERGLHLATVDFRGGYRYRFRHRDGLAPYLGLGLGSPAQAVGSPRLPGDGQPYLSPEVGLHFGRDDAFFPGLQLGLEGEAFIDGSPARIQGTAAWTIW